MKGKKIPPILFSIFLLLVNLSSAEFIEEEGSGAGRVLTETKTNIEERSLPESYAPSLGYELDPGTVSTPEGDSQAAFELGIIPIVPTEIGSITLPRRADSLRVAVYRRAGLLYISATREFTVTDLATGKALSKDKAYTQWKFRKVESGIETNLMGTHRGPIRVETANPQGRIMVGTELYRGKVDIVRDGAGLNVVNIVNVEDYLYGVLPKEVPENWPTEALKAQAIASRSYALYRKLNNPAGGYYDLDSTVYSQVYGGAKHEDERTNRAVDETRGLVLTYGGRVIQALFHAASGGHTEPVGNVWGVNGDSPAPYLDGVADPFGSDGYSHRWSRTISLEVVRRRLTRNGIAVGCRKSIEVVDRNAATDRVLLLKIVHDAGGPHYISGHKFRMAVGAAYDVKSTMFQVESQDGVLRLSGLGYGHGVGLPQESARAMAEKGYDHPQILSYFYPGVEFRRFSVRS